MPTLCALGGTAAAGHLQKRRGVHDKLQPAAFSVEGALLSGMRVGGVRRVIIFPGAASYPGMLPNDKGRNWSQLGPAPETLSGRRSLDFVAKNTANVDKSLLMDIELLGVGEGARAVRGPGAWTPEALAAAKTGSL